MANMFMGNNPAEVIKHLGQRGLDNVNVAATGTITSIDTQNFLAKVMLGVSGIETGWLPIGTILAGNGYGVVAIPEQNTEVTVVFDGADLQSGKIILCNFNDMDQPPQGMNPGEILIQSKGNAKVKFGKDGKVTINDGTKYAARVGDRVDLNPDSSTYGQIISGNSTILI